MEPEASPNRPGNASGWLHLLQALAINLVTIAGIWLWGWGTTTTLALYWCGNVLGSLAVATRLALHKRLTHDPGYDHNQLGISTGSSKGPQQPIRHFIPEFLTGTFVFSAAHGLFLAFLVGKFLPEAGGTALDPVAFRRGLASLAAISVVGLLADLPKLGERPFSWAVAGAKAAMRRVIVVHLTIIFGFAMLAWKHEASAFLATFAIVKLLFDLGASWPTANRAALAAGTPSTPPVQAGGPPASRRRGRGAAAP